MAWVNPTQEELEQIRFQVIKGVDRLENELQIEWLDYDYVGISKIPIDGWINNPMRFKK